MVNRMDESLTMEIKDNAFARQFETTLEDELISVVKRRTKTHKDTDNFLSRY
jgi:hypothetical protein